MGSVKSNIGHLEAAGGLAGLAKVLLQMQHRQLTASLHAEELSPFIDFDDSPFYLNREAKPWTPKQAGRPLRAGLNCFGAGGANVHLILEAPVAQTPSPSSEPEILTFSANTPEQLQALLSKYRDFLKQNTCSLRDMAATMQLGRVAQDHRLALVCTTQAEAIAAIDAALNGQTHSSQQTHSQQLANTWASGGVVDWQSYNQQRPFRRIALPTYAFAETRHWLRQQAQPETPTAPRVASDTPMTNELISLAIEVLPLTEVDPNATLRETGLDSLMGLKLVARIEKQYGKKLPLRTLLGARSLNDLGQAMIQHGFEPKQAPEPVVQPEADSLNAILDDLKHGRVLPEEAIKRKAALSAQAG